MTDRDNETRQGLAEERVSSLEEVKPQPLSFAAPTEMVDLPSGGRFYPPNHPLHGKKTIEIKYMTAKEEDILTSRSLLKKGLALDRLIESVILSPKVSADDLLMGDKNAILVAARITGYGSDYETKVVCPECEAKTSFSFNLEEQKTNKGGDSTKAIPTDTGTWKIALPKSKWEVEVKLMYGSDEKRLSELMQQKKKNNLPENTITEQLNMIIVSVEGKTDREDIRRAVNVMPAHDAKYLRTVYAEISPGVDLTQKFKCSQCEAETEMEVPFSTDFFWAK